MKISGKVIDVLNRKIFSAEIIIEGEKILKIVPAEHSEGRFILPGLIDSHVHIESSMVIPSHFAVAAVKHGTVAVISDPHEIANVLGTEGVKFMKENASGVPLRFVFGAPSCVPATKFETSGAEIHAADIERLFEEGYVEYLAEVMNFPGVINEDEEVWRKINIAKKRNVKIDGHAPELSGEDLVKYVNSGITTDHECSSLEEAKEKISLGMKILIREGSAAKNLQALSPLFNFSPESIMLCTDDLHPENLEKGHINLIISRLIKEGYDLFNVLSSATAIPQMHYGLDTGLLREGDDATFIVVDDPAKMNVLETWIKGSVVYDGERVMFRPGKANKPNRFNCSPVMEEDLRIIRKSDKIRVIVAFNGELFTGTEITSSGEGPTVNSRPGDDILKIVVKDRYNDAPPAVAFIKGLGLKKGAFATSVAHDCHNIIAVGSNDRDITTAINLIVNAEGGMSVVSDEEEELLKLPVAGLMSDMPVSAIAFAYERLSATVKSLGCRMTSPYMTLSFMALLVIPELKLSDRGLFNGKDFCHVSLFAD